MPLIRRDIVRRAVASKRKDKVLRQKRRAQCIRQVRHAAVRRTDEDRPERPIETVVLVDVLLRRDFDVDGRSHAWIETNAALIAFHHRSDDARAEKTDRLQGQPLSA
jgi:hypothetical protein